MLPSSQAGRAALTRFQDVQRPLSMFVSALVPDPGLARQARVFVAPAGVRRCFANEHGLFFPDSFLMLSGVAGRTCYFAAAAHLVAHLRFGGARLVRGSLRAIQVVLVSLFEDARVEARLSDELPGLAPLWRSFHSARPTEHVIFPTLCARISRALSDPLYDDPHPIVDKARHFFREQGEATTTEDCRRYGSLLGNDVGQSRLTFSEREYLVEPVYRDDHQLLWQELPQDSQPTHEHAEQLERARQRAASSLSATAQAHEPRASVEPSPALELAVASERTIEPVVPLQAAPRELKYPEFDYQIGVCRPDFCTILELTPTRSDDSQERVQRPNRKLPEQLLRLAGALKLETRRRRRRQRDGDSIDLDAALEARIDVRAHHTPDERVYVDIARRRQPLALLLLLDLSESTGARVPDSDQTLLELARDASLLLGDVLSHVGDSFAIHGFSSNGRQQVEYHRFKDFAEPWDGPAQARLSDLTPRLSTRMGTALRHAARVLAEAPAERRLLLLLTDGEPSDVDAPDPQYLLHDARHAVAQTRRRDVEVLALSLDAQGAPYLQRIFGAGRYLVLPHLQHLPRVLTDLYARVHG